MVNCSQNGNFNLYSFPLSVLEISYFHLFLQYLEFSDFLIFATLISMKWHFILFYFLGHIEIEPIFLYVVAIHISSSVFNFSFASSSSFNSWGDFSSISSVQPTYQSWNRLSAVSISRAHSIDFLLEWNFMHSCHRAHVWNMYSESTLTSVWRIKLYGFYLALWLNNFLFRIHSL